MTDTDTLVPPRTLMFMADASLSVNAPFTMEFAKGANGKNNLILKDVPLFRSGTFADSMGEVHTFDEFHIQGFVRNFDHLKSNKIFSDVPARRGHRQGGIFASGDPIDGVVGYVDSIRTEKRKAPHDGNEYDYLIGDVTVIEEKAQQNISSGLWRNRSAEIGTYKDNNGAEYAPAFLGFAFVDMAAIEGLNFSQEKTDVLFMEDTMTGVATPPPVGENKPFMFTCGTNQIFEPEKVQAYIADIEAQFAAATAANTAKDAEIKSLKDFKEDIERTERVEFVNGLVKSNRLLVTQEKDTLELVSNFSNEQFDSWKAIMGTIPENPLLGEHGSQESKATANSGGSGEYSQEDNDKDTLKRMKRIGKSEEVLKVTKAYQRLLAKDANFSLASI